MHPLLRLYRLFLTAFAAESLWMARGAILVTIVLQTVLQEKFTLGHNLLLPGLELAVLGVLLLVSRFGADAEHLQRMVVIVLVGLINVANVYSLVSLVDSLLEGSKASGVALLVNALNIWFTNLVIFALWYFELDRGGPLCRHKHHARHPDFLFPQMTNPELAKPNWRPGFLDYLFISFTNATAFSPTDTLPLTPAAKLLMLLQSAISLLTVALVAARAINILR